MLQDGQRPRNLLWAWGPADGVSRQPCQLSLWASPSPRQESEYGQAAGVELGRASLPSRDLASARCPGWGGGNEGGQCRADHHSAPARDWFWDPGQTGGWSGSVSYNGDPADRVQMAGSRPRNQNLWPSWQRDLGWCQEELPRARTGSFLIPRGTGPYASLKQVGRSRPLMRTSRGPGLPLCQTNGLSVFGSVSRRLPKWG